MRRNKQTYADMGSLSTGTMREQDLIPVFVAYADSLALTRAERKEVTAIKNKIAKTSGDGDAYWTSEDAGDDLNETLFGILNNHAMPYFYFGSHPGDGADYGFWLSEEFEDSFDGLKVNDTSEVPKGYTGEVLHVNDHGNMTLYVASRGKLREVWAVV